VPVFGILERDGRVHVSVVPDVSAQRLLKLTVKKVRRGSVVYTDKFKSYDILMFYGYRHLKVDHHKYFSSGRVDINGPVPEAPDLDPVVLHHSIFESIENEIHDPGGMYFG
jgi:hypothetical protein